MRVRGPGESDDEVIALVLEHVRRDHPDLAGTEGPDDIRGWLWVRCYWDARRASSLECPSARAVWVPVRVPPKVVRAASVRL